MLFDFLQEVPNEDVRELFKNPSLEEFGTKRQASVQDLFRNPPIVHHDYWKDRSQKKITDAVKHVIPKLGYHGQDKYKYAFHEPWKPLDRVGFLELAEKESRQIEDAAVNAHNQT